MPGPSRRARRLPYVAIALSLALGAIAFWPLQNYAHERIRAFQADIVALVERSTGYTLRYRSMNPSILLQTELTDFQLLRPDRSVFLAADRVRVSYDIFKFLGAQPLKAIQSIELEGGRLDWIASRDRLFSLGPSAAPTSARPGIELVRQALDGLSSALPDGLAVIFVDTKATLSADGWQAGFDLPRLELANAANDLRFGLDMDMELKNIQALSAFGVVTGRLHAAGTFFKRSRQIQAQVSTGRLQTAVGDLLPQKFAAVLGNDALEIRKVEDNQAFDLKAVWNFADDELRLDLAADHWRPSRAFAANARLDPVVEDILKAQFTAKVGLRYGLGSKRLAYDFRVDADSQDTDAVAIHAEGAGVGLDLERLAANIAIPGMKLAYQGSLDLAGGTSAGALDFDVFAPLLSVPVTLTATVRGDRRAPATRLYLADAVLHAGETALAIDEVPLRFGAGTMDFTVGAGLLDSPAGPGSIALEGQVSLLPHTPTLALSGRVDSLPLQDGSGIVRTLAALAKANLALKTAKAIPAGQKLWGSFNLTLDPELRLRVDDYRIGAGGDEEPFLRGSLAFRDMDLEFEKTAMRGPGGPVDIEGGLRFGADKSMALRLDIDRGKPGAFSLDGSLQADSSFEIQGPHGLFVSGDLKDGAARAFARVEALPLAALGERASLSATANAAIDANGVWSLALSNADLVNIAWNPLAPARTGRFILRDGTVNAKGGRIEDIQYQDSASALSGAASLNFPNGDFSVCVLAANLESKASVAQPRTQGAVEQLQVDLSYERGVVRSSLALRNSGINRFFDNPLRGTFDLQAELTGTVERFADTVEINGSADLSQAFWSQDPLKAAAGFSYAKRKLTISRGVVSSGKRRLDIAELALDGQKGSLAFNGHLSDERSSGAPAVEVAGAVDWDPARAGADVVNGMRGSVSARNVTGLDGKTHSYLATIKGDAKGLELSEALQNAFRASFSADGAFVVQLFPPLPVAATIAGQVRQGRVEANITNLNFDLATLSDLLNVSLFRMTEGQLGGSLRLVGDLFDPSMYGSLRFANFKARTPVSPDEFDAALGFIVLDDHKLRLLPMTAGAGKSKLRVDGEFQVSRLNVAAFQLNFLTLSDPGVHIASTFSNIMVDGRAQGKFSVNYTPDLIDLRGKLVVSDAKLQLSPAQGDAPKAPASPYAPEQVPIALGLDLKTGRSVEFIWPNSTFPVLQTTLDINQNAAFNYNQVSGTWNLVGQVSARGGEILYLKRNFFLRQASINFNENNNKDFDPVINARAETKVFVDNRQARIALTYRDCYLSDLRPQISSDLTFTNEQLNAIVSGDYVDMGTNANSIDNVLSNSIGYASIALMPNVESRIRDFLGLDMFSLRSSLLSNLAKNLWQGNGNNPLDNQTTSLGKYLDATTVQVGKFIGNNIYLEVLAQFRSVAQSTPGNPNGNPLGLTIDPELSLEWNTPFFDLQWVLAPENVFQPSLGDFIKNNTLRFSWQIR